MSCPLVSFNMTIMPSNRQASVCIRDGSIPPAWFTSQGWTVFLTTAPSYRSSLCPRHVPQTPSTTPQLLLLSDGQTRPDLNEVHDGEPHAGVQ